MEKKEMKKVLWLTLSGLMTLSLLIAACGPAATPTAPTTPTTPTAPTTPKTPTTPTTPTEQPAQKEPTTPAATAPKYGGTLNRYYSGGALSFNDSNVSPQPAVAHVNQKLMEGDWTKGNAGGLGSKETRWGTDYPDIFALKTGMLATSAKWSADFAKDEGIIIYQIRQGVRWAKPNTDAGRLMNGREFNADDVVFNLKRNVQQAGMTIYRSNPELRTANITKTGPFEVTIKTSIVGLMSGLSRFSDSNVMYSPEVVAKYGHTEDWKNSIGTGPYILTEYVAGSQVLLEKNPDYWEKDPIGPGKGNQLPYLDRVRYVGIPDLSTRMAALRTGKIDESAGLGLSEAQQLRKIPGLLETVAFSQEGRGYSAQIVHDRPPFNDIRVRQALLLATDFNKILKELWQGEGLIMNYPIGYTPEYKELFLSLDDPDFPPAARALYNYNPDKAKQLLKEAGYPTGFKTTVLISSGNTASIDYYSIIKDMWSKVGIELTFDLKESAAFSSFLIAKQQTALVSRNTAPIGQWMSAIQISGDGEANAAKVKDATVEDWLSKIRTTAITDIPGAMKQYREMTKYIAQQTWGVPEVTGYRYTYWWPWLKNYSGEFSIGYANYAWDRYIWYDQALKKSMGY